MQRRRPLIIGAGLLVLASAGLIAWRAGGDATTAADAGHWQKPQRRVLGQPVLLKGTLLPVASVNVTAPADGRLVERPVQFGERVSAGQFVARIESPELLSQLRDAEIAAIRAGQDLESARSIDQGAEHQAAQRRLRQAEGVLSTARRRAAETQTLYDKGVVARVELEGAQQEVQNAEAQMQGARDEIDALLQKRSRNALRILELDAQGRRQKLAELRATREALRITAPIAGIVLYPNSGDGDPASNGSAAKEIKPGSAVSSRDVLLSIGDTTAFVVKAWADEQDVQRLEVNRPASVRLDADPTRELAGQVLRVSLQSRAQEARGGPPAVAEFEVQVLVRPAAGQALRVGSLAKVRVESEPAPAGLLVPLTALQWGDEGRPQLRVRSPGGKSMLRSVELGRTQVDAVEVRGGIDERDEVWVPDVGAGSTGAPGRLPDSD